jgi:hypothetical protein
LEAEKKQIARDALHEALANEMLTDENRQLREQVAEIKKELAFRDFGQAQQSNIAMLNGTYEELRMALSAEIALHAAWTKRANEAEAAVAEAEVIRDAAVKRLSLVWDFQNKDYWCWGNDEHDHLESLVCPIVITADDLRSIVNDRKEQP